MLNFLAKYHSDKPEVVRILRTLRIGQILDSDHVDQQIARSEIDSFWREYEPDDWLRACDAYLAAVHERNIDRCAAMVAQIGVPSTVAQLEFAARAAMAKLHGDNPSAQTWLELMDYKVAAGSPYRDLTFRDIRRQIETIAPLQDC